MHFVSPNLYVCTHQQLLEPTSLLLQVGTRPLSKPQPLFPQVAVKGKNESSLTETAHRVPYHVSKAPLRSAKAAQHAAATSQATTTLSYSTPRGRYSAWGPPQPFTPLRPSHKRTSPPRPPLQLGPARTPSSALACKDPSSAAARSFSGNRLAEKVRHAPPVSKRKGGTARHASPTIDITTSAEAALIPAWTPATPRTPSTPCDKPSKDPPAPLSMPASTANHGPQVLNPPAHEGQVTAGQGQHEAPRVDTPYPFATAATPNTVCSPTPPMLEPALGPSSTPASLQGMTHLSNKDSSLSKCQTPLQVPPCTPAPFLAAPGTHHEPEGERDEGNTTSSALIGPATTHSSTAAADASTPTSACLAGSAEVLVMLEGNGWMERGRFPHTTTLGEVVLRWAQHTSTAVNIIKLRHASDDEYLSDDYWWSPLGQIRLVTNRLLLLEVIVDNFNLEQYITAEQAPVTPTKTPSATPLSIPAASASPTPECNAADDTADAVLQDSLAALTLPADPKPPPTPALETPLVDTIPLSASCISDCCLADDGAIAPQQDSLAALTLADANPASTPASHPSGSVGVTLVYKGMEVACNSWSGDTLLGGVVGAWAEQQQVAVATLWLRHESDDEYLADDVWLCDLAALARQWGDAFVIEVCVPSEDQEDDYVAEVQPSARAQALPVTPASTTRAPAVAPASASPTPACQLADDVAIAFPQGSLAFLTLADANASPTPASHPSGSVGVTLVHKGVEVACNSWSGCTLLGEVVGAWAEQQQVSAATLWLRHESQDDYLADDVWLCDLAALARQWGDAFVVKVCVPSEDQVPALWA
ncbi:hypothetical protein ABBQ38_015048 [Trebouxia sp. C0009 RCD-2024]